jgi:mRNA interferase RelE/StbE
LAAEKTINYKASVEKDLRAMGHVASLRVMAKLEKTLRASDHPGEPLSGEFAGLSKIRVGDYRVIFCKTVEGFLVLRIAHRRDVYRKGRP